MHPLHLELSQPQIQALSRLLIQIPAHNLREWADSEAEAQSMRQALDTLNRALASLGPNTPCVTS